MNRLLYVSLPSHSKPVHSLVFSLASDLSKIVLNEVLTGGLIAILILLSLFVCLNTFVEALAFFSDFFLLPRTKWAFSFLEMQRECNQKLFKPYAVIAIFVLILVGLWLFANLENIYSSLDKAASLSANIIIFVGTLILAFNYWAQIKWGLLRYLENVNLRFTDLIRVLFARFMSLFTIFIAFFLGLLALENLIIPTFIEGIQITESKVATRTASFKIEVAEMGNSEHLSKSIVSKVSKMLNESRKTRESLLKFTNILFAKTKPAIGIIVFLSLLTLIYFPLIHREIKFAPFFAGIIILSLIGTDYILRLAPIVFRFGKSGPSALVLIIGFGMIFGEAISRMVTYVFQKHIECGYCKKANLLGAKFCIECGNQLTQSPKKSNYFGNQRTHYVHISVCPLIQRIEKGKLLTFNKLDDAIKQGYRCCALCLKRENKRLDTTLSL